MIALNLTGTQARSMINALYTAADAYDGHAISMKGAPGIADHFRAQAKTARELATIIARS